jgi:hypothetical protein
MRKKRKKIQRRNELQKTFAQAEAAATELWPFVFQVGTFSNPCEFCASLRQSRALASPGSGRGWKALTRDQYEERRE